MAHDLNDELTAQLSAYLDDALDPAERTAVESQLAASPEARAVLDELRQVKSLVSDLPRAGAPDDLVEALSEHIERQALLGEAEPLRVPVERRPWQVGKLLATAAVFAIVCTAGFIVMMQLQSSDAPITTVALVESEEAQPEPEESAATTVTRVEPALSALRIESQAAKPAIELSLIEADKSGFSILPGPVTAGLDLTLAGESKAADELALAPAPRNARGLTQLARNLGERVGGVFESLRQATRVAPSEDRNVDAYSYLSVENLEQKIEAGLPVQTLASHAFDNESVRLDVATAMAEDRTRVDQRIRTFFANNGIVAAETLPQESAVALTQAFYLPGRPEVNFGYSAPEATSSRVYAVRLAQTQLTALLGELQSGEPGQVQLQTLRVGPAVSQDWTSATQLAEMLAPTSEVIEETLAVATNEARRINLEAGEVAVPRLQTARASGRAKVQATDEQALLLNRSTQAAAPTEPTPAVALREPNQKLREEQFDDAAQPAQRGRSRTPTTTGERLGRQIARAPARTAQPETENLAKGKAEDANRAVALNSLAKDGAQTVAKPSASRAFVASRPARTSTTRPSLAFRPDAGVAGGAGSRGGVAADSSFGLGEAQAKTAPATAPAGPSDKPEPLLTLVLTLHGPAVTTAPTSSPVVGRPLTTTQPGAP